MWAWGLISDDNSNMPIWEVGSLDLALEINALELFEVDIHN